MLPAIPHPRKPRWNPMKVEAVFTAESCMHVLCECVFMCLAPSFLRSLPRLEWGCAACGAGGCPWAWPVGAELQYCRRLSAHHEIKTEPEYSFPN
jgi:hypothetical protein